MTITELHSREEVRLREFPVARDRIFLAHAGVCPLPRRVAQAIAEYAQSCTRGDQEELISLARMTQGRAMAARLIGAKPEEIAFVGPTSLGLSFVAKGLSFEAGDNVVIYRDDYPSNVYPWMILSERGVEVRSVAARELGRLEWGDIQDRIDSRTRVVALASCHFISGFRIDLEGIGRELRERRILFCVDGIQTVGAFPVRAEHIDFLAADAHKWMLGPCGAGIFYVRKEVQDLLPPMAIGWHNVRCPNYVAQDTLRYRQDARKYEAGSHNLVGWAGLEEAIKMLLEVGIENIATELIRKRHWLAGALQEKGYRVLHGDLGAEQAGGLISFWKAGGNMAGVQERLEKGGVTASLRTDRAGQQYIRWSPHFYNTDSELNLALECL